MTSTSTVGGSPGRRRRFAVTLTVGVLATILVACSSTATPGGIGLLDQVDHPAGRPPRHDRSHRHHCPGRQPLHPDHRIVHRSPHRAPGLRRLWFFAGEVNGREIIVDSADDGYNNGANNKALTQADIGKDFAIDGVLPQ